MMDDGTNRWMDGGMDDGLYRSMDGWYRLMDV